MDGSVVTSLEPLSYLITVVRWQDFENRSSFTCAVTWSRLLVQFQRSKNIFGNLGPAHSSTLPGSYPQTPGHTRNLEQRGKKKIAFSHARDQVAIALV